MPKKPGGMRRGDDAKSVNVTSVFQSDGPTQQGKNKTQFQSCHIPPSTPHMTATAAGHREFGSADAASLLASGAAVEKLPGSFALVGEEPGTNREAEESIDAVCAFCDVSLVSSTACV